MSNDRRFAISGKSGCGNTSVSRRLAEKLGIRLVNFTFRDLAHEVGVSFEELCSMAEQDNQWDYMVDRRQLEIAKQQDCVLGSRLAVWLWKDAALRVYLDAPIEVRSQRIFQREGGADLETIKEKTIRRDQRDHDRYKRLYNIDNNDFGFVDLVIDSSKFTVEEIVEQIHTAWMNK